MLVLEGNTQNHTSSCRTHFLVASIGDFDRDVSLHVRLDHDVAPPKVFLVLTESQLPKLEELVGTLFFPFGCCLFCFVFGSVF